MSELLHQSRPVSSNFSRTWWQMFKHLLKLFPIHHFSLNIDQVPGQMLKQDKYSDFQKNMFNIAG